MPETDEGKQWSSIVWKFTWVSGTSTTSSSDTFETFPCSIFSISVIMSFPFVLFFCLFFPLLALKSSWEWMNEWVSEWMNERKPEVLSINCLSMDHCGAALCKGFPRLPSSRRRTRNLIKLLSDRLIFTHFNLLFLHVPTAWSFNCLGRKRMDENRKSIRKVCCLSAF